MEIIIGSKFRAGIDYTESKSDVVITDQKNELVASFSLYMDFKTREKVKNYNIHQTVILYKNNRIYHVSESDIPLSSNFINEYKRIEILGEETVRFLKGYIDSLESLNLEGYAFLSNSKILNRAEATGYLKLLMYKENIKYELVPPTSLKKFATGIGSGKKDAIGYFFKKNYPEYELYTDDQIDAFYLSIYKETKPVKKNLKGR